MHRLMAWVIYTKNEPRYVSQDQANFPLGNMLGWQKVFGPSFIERQVVIGFAEFELFIDELIPLMRLFKINSSLCAIKIFNSNGPGDMSFVRPGVSFNILHPGDQLDFTKKLNCVLNRYGAVEYLGKSQAGISIFPKGYGNYTTWLQCFEKNAIKSMFVERHNSQIEP